MNWLKKVRRKLTRKYQRGYAMAWNAIFLGFVVAPLCVLCVDVVREAAANALDVPTFEATGVARINLNIGVGWATQQFNQTVVDQGIIAYSPSLGSVHLQTPTVVACSATAHVHNLIPMAPDLTPRVSSTSEMKVGRR